MTTDHEQYADWDGAYVLGALPPEERVEYERHLAVCDQCRTELAELLPLPGLLRRVDDTEREALLGGKALDEPPVGLETRLLEAARAESAAQPRAGSVTAPAAAGPAPVVPLWRRTRTRVALGIAAAAAVAAAVVVPLATRDEPSARPTASVTLRQTVPTELTASVALTRTAWGTRIDMVCAYHEESGYPEGRVAYGLFVIDREGHDHLVSTWWAGPGEEAHTTGSIDLAVDQLRTLQVRAADGRTVLLSGTV
jgi:hypothetical protein